MSYKVNRALGYQKWGVTNPWVFANFGQPQRKRGYVSPVVFQTAPPSLRTVHLGLGQASDADLDQIQREVDAGVRPASDLVQAMYPEMMKSASPVEKHLLKQAEDDRKRGERMERYAMAGVALSVVSVAIAYNRYSKRSRARVSANRRRRRRRTSRR